MLAHFRKTFILKKTNNILVHHPINVYCCVTSHVILTNFWRFLRFDGVFSKYLRILCNTYQSEFIRSLTWILLIFFSPATMLPALVCCKTETRGKWQNFMINQRKNMHEMWPGSHPEQKLLSVPLSLPSPDRAVYEPYTVYERTLSDVHADHLFLFMRLGEWNASLRCLDFILSLPPKNRVFLIAVLNCVVPGSLALSCKWPQITNSETDRPQVSARSSVIYGHWHFHFG